MGEETLLTIDQAAAASGFGKKALRAMVKDGTLPAVRREGSWRIAAADLLGLSGAGPGRVVTMLRGAPPPAQGSATRSATQRDDRATKDDLKPGGAGDFRTAPSILAAPASVEQNTVTSSAYPAVEVPRGELLIVLDMLAQRDAQIADLQNERARLYAQLGLLQGVLAEREGRLRPLEVQRVETARHEGASRLEGAHQESQDPLVTGGLANSVPAVPQRERASTAVGTRLSGTKASGHSSGPQSTGLSRGVQVLPTAAQRKVVATMRRFFGLRG